MDVSGLIRPPQVKSVATTGRRLLLGDLLSPPPSDSGSSSSTTSDDLTEDDVFWIDDLVTADFHFHETNDDKLSSSSAPSSSSSLHRNNRTVPPFGSTESFGILAALSDYDKRSVLSLKARSIAASSRMIPKPAQERLVYRSASSFSAASTRKYQSAPVKVPMMQKRIIGTRRLAFDDEDDRDDMMLPPHEIVARTMQRSHSQIAAYSVLEGAGRTLKGRDLRQVRNAIWRRTGFLD